MGLMEQEIKELRDMQQQLISKKITAEDVHARIAIYSQTEKRVKMMLQAFAAAMKHGGGTSKMLLESNLVGGRIDINADPELEKIKCPAVNKVITRHECLDYSGDSEHVKSCMECPQFDVTRSMLIPAKETK